MVCFIRSISTWAHVAQCDVLDFEIPLFSTEDDSGTIQVEGEHPDLSMNWAIIGGQIFYVESCSPADGTTDLTVSRPMNAFDRTLTYEGTGSEQIESFMETAIDEYFVQQEDPEYAMPYLSVISVGETEVELAYIPGETYPFLDIIDLAYEQDIRFLFIPSSSGLQLIIGPAQNSVHHIFFDDGHNALEEVTVSNELVAKVTVRKVVSNSDESIEVLETRDYYWNKDGSITQTIPSPRLKGLWQTVSVEATDDEIPSTTVNLCPPYSTDTWTAGYLATNGTISSPDGTRKEVTSPFIEVNAETAYVFSYGITENPTGSNPYWAAICFYNSNNGFIGNRTVATANTNQYVTATSPANSAFARVSFRGYGGPGNVQLETGTVPTEYTPWIDPNDPVDPDEPVGIMYDAAVEAMLDNDEAVKLTFYSDKTLAMGDWIRCKVNNELVSTRITSCVYKYGEDRLLYKAGEMPTTLTEKFADEVYQKKTQGVSNESSSPDYLSKTGGTVNQVAVAGTMTTQGLVVGSESQGSALPISGEEGQVFFLV